MNRLLAGKTITIPSAADAQAIPQADARQEVQAQSADINGVSGATYTSRSYVASLQSAIDAAKQASGVTG